MSNNASSQTFFFFRSIAHSFRLHFVHHFYAWNYELVVFLLLHSTESIVCTITTTSGSMHFFLKLYTAANLRSWLLSQNETAPNYVFQRNEKKMNTHYPDYTKFTIDFSISCFRHRPKREQRGFYLQFETIPHFMHQWIVINYFK